MGDGRRPSRERLVELFLLAANLSCEVSEQSTVAEILNLFDIWQVCPPLLPAVAPKFLVLPGLPFPSASPFSLPTIVPCILAGGLQSSTIRQSGPLPQHLQCLFLRPSSHLPLLAQSVSATCSPSWVTKECRQ